MVRKWRREGGEGWLTSALFNLIGAVATGLVLVVVAVTKFAEGAWIILVLIPLLVLWFRSVHNHYARVGEQLSLRGWTPEPRHHNTVLVPISGIHRAGGQA